MTDLNLSLRLSADNSGLVGEVRVSRGEVEKLTKSVEGSGRSSREAASELNSYSKQLDQTQNRARRLSRDTQGLTNQMKSQRVAAQQAARGLGSLRGVATGLGYQMQDIAVQLQSGTNAMLVLGQQGSQIASLFGPAGAVAGAVIAIGAAVGASLVPSLFSGADAAEDLDNAFDRLEATMKRTKEGTFELTEEIRALARINKEAAQLQIRVAQQDALDAAKAAVRQLREELDGLSGLRNDFNISINDLGQLIRLLNKPIDDTSGLVAANELLTRLVLTNKDAAPELVRLAQSVSQAGLQLKEAEDSAKWLKDLPEDFEDAGEAADKHKDRVESMVAAITLEAQTLGFTDAQRALYVATLKGATAEQLRAIETSYALIEAHEKEAQAAKDLALANKQKVADAQRLSAENDREIAQIVRMDEQKKQQLQRRLDALADIASTQVEREQRRYAQALQDLNAAERQKLDTILSYKELRVRLEEDHSKRLEEIAGKPKGEELTGFDALFGKGALEHVFQDLDNIESRFKALLVRLALEAAQSKLLELFGSGAAGGSTGGNIFSSLLGGLFGGGKASGGPVDRGRLYEVNERRPELLSVGGRDFLMMGAQSGRVTPNPTIQAPAPVVQQGNTNNVVVLDGNSVIDALGTAKGTRTQLQHVRVNRAQWRAALGL